EIGFNTIRRTGRSGITIREMANSDVNNPKARVHHNDIGDFMLQDWDGGAIYTASQDANFTRIDHNWMHDATGHTVAGFYPDYTKNWIVDHNVTWNVEWGIHLEGQHESGVVNALVFNNTTLSRDQFIGIGNGQAPGSYYFNNIHNQNFGKAADGARERSHNLQWDNRANSVTDPKFANLATNDFTLQSDSQARDTGRLLDSVSTLQPGNPEVVVKLPFEMPRDGKPDVGAYEHGEPIWKAGSTLARGVTAPAAPGTLRAAAVAASRVNLSWSDAADNETGFSIERKSAASAWKQIGVVPTNTIEFYDNGLSKATEYSYRVRAVNSAGTSAFSAVATAKTPAITRTDAHIAHTADAPKIDGQVDGSWHKAEAFPIAGALGGTITDDADLSGSWRALWDEKYLYVLIEAVDDKVLANEGAAWYSVDSAEIYLDADDSKKSAYDRINDFQISFGAQTGALNLGQNSARDKMTFPFAVVKTDAGYRVEAALPWSEILGYAPQAGALIGFDVHLTDSDDGATWKGKKSWHTKDNTSWFDPRLNGTVELVK
ncbi:MAG TPA: sugar-binding protein, partial [Abditibacteriaceae bacterium]